MGVKVSIDLNGVEKKLNSTNIKRGRYAFMNQAHSDMERYVPKRQGNLRNDSYVDKGNESIRYTAPYAKAQFYGMVNGSQIKHYSTPGTTRRWDLKAKGVYVKDWIRAFNKGANL